VGRKQTISAQSLRFRKNSLIPTQTSHPKAYRVFRSLGPDLWSKLHSMNPILLFATIVFMVFSTLHSSTATAETDVADTIAKAANYIYSTDFTQGPVVDTFSEDELRVLGKNPDALNSLIKSALGLQHSVGGAMLMAHFRLQENFDYLRHRMLEPGRRYGWEGTYANDEERYYSDHQYVYHTRYLPAIEELIGSPLHESIELTDKEKKRIDDLVASPTNESHHWSIWISRKLGL